MAPRRAQRAQQTGSAPGGTPGTRPDGTDAQITPACLDMAADLGQLAAKLIGMHVGHDYELFRHLSTTT